MAIAKTAKRLYQGTLGTSDAAALYTVPSSTWALVRNIYVCNSNASARTYRLSLVKSGGSMSTANTIAYDANLNAGATDEHNIFQLLSAGDMIRGYASAGSSVGVNVSGVEITGTFVNSTPLMMVQALLTNSSVLQYTVTTGKKAIIKDVIVTNITPSTAATFRLDVVKNGSSVGTDTQIFNAYSVAGANTRPNFNTRLTTMLESQDKIYAQASANNNLAMVITGVEVG